MLTPAKIKNHHFDAAGRNSYKAESVDSFFEEVAESYEQMFKENGEMYKKIGLLAERLEEYKNDEDNIRNALLMAQRMAEKITREAQEKADALLSDAETRAKTENDRIDAVSNDMLQKATYQAQAIVADAQAQADKLLYDATYESKAAAVSARDTMIKEEAALEMMKVEVTKFKKQILDAYNEQLALIEQLPEIVYAKFEEPEEETTEGKAEEVTEEITEEVVEETAEEVTEEVFEETAEEVTEEAAEVVEEIEEISAEGDDNNFFEKFEEAEEVTEQPIDVEQLQQMIADTEDTDAEAETFVYEEEEESEDVYSGDTEYIIPEIDDETEVVDKLTEEISKSKTPDIMFTKPKDGENKGFNINLESIEVVDDEDDDDDEIDDFDDDDGGNNENGGFASKFKGFFKK